MLNWNRLNASLLALERKELELDELCRIWRSETIAAEFLPDRYRSYLEDVLLRLESGSSFTEESCSFSVKDLREALQIWLDKARAL